MGGMVGDSLMGRDCFWLCGGRRRALGQRTRESQNGVFYIFIFFKIVFYINIFSVSQFIGLYPYRPAGGGRLPPI